MATKKMEQEKKGIQFEEDATRCFVKDCILAPNHLGLHQREEKTMTLPAHTCQQTSRKVEALRWRHEFQVEGLGVFPFDMLRYDECFPSRTEDMAEITLSRKDSETKTRKVSLVSYSVTKSWTPTWKRWASFGWRVTGLH